MDTPHPTVRGRFPPDELTFAGYLMLRVARSLDDVEDLREWVTDVVEAGDFADSFPDDPEPTLEEALAVLDEVVAEHERLVPAPSQDAAAFLGVLEQLVRRGIGVSFGEAFDAAEGAETGVAAARALGPAARGYVYAHTQDVDGMVLGDRIHLGFAGMSPSLSDEAARVGHEVAGLLSSAGLSVDWDGDPRGRILVGPIRWAWPAANGPVRVGPADVDTPPTPPGRSWWRRMTGR